MSSAPPPVTPHRSPPSEPSPSWPQFVIFVILLIVIAVILQLTATPASTPIAAPTSQPASAPADEEELFIDIPSTMPLTTAPASQSSGDPNLAEVNIQSLADSQQGWLRINQQSAFGKSSTARGHYLGDNEFSIDTKNVEAFQIDLSMLKVRKGGTFILHIDGQNMTLTPRRQSFITFRRTAAGVWELEKN